MIEKGKVYLVGAGPAGKDLITVKGLEVLRQADAVIYDYLIDKELLQEAKEGAELICCDKLRGKKYSDGFLIHNEKIGQLVAKKAKEGKKVVRLKNGDPSIFSRLSQELEPLVKNKIEFEVVPGVTAASAASCFSGVPLTDRRFSSSVVFVTGHEAAGKDKALVNWKDVAANGSIVLYMAVENISKVAAELIKAGKSARTPIVAISQAGKINQRIVVAVLKNIHEAVKENRITAPAIFIIGSVVRLNERFDWLNKNRRILFTGLSAKRFFLKGNYSHQPMIRIVPLDNYSTFDRHLRKICSFNWIVFTSRYAVQYFFQRLIKIGFDGRCLHNIKIAAVGASTATKLEEFSVIADLIPKVESSKGLLATFKRIDLKGEKIFLPCSNISDKGLSAGLRNLGAKVAACVAYKNIAPLDLPDLDLKTFDQIIFTSPSGVRNFARRYGKPPQKVGITCIGEVTRAQAKKFHFL